MDFSIGCQKVGNKGVKGRAFDFGDFSAGFLDQNHTSRDIPGVSFEGIKRITAPRSDISKV